MGVAATSSTLPGGLIVGPQIQQAGYQAGPGQPEQPRPVKNGLSEPEIKQAKAKHAMANVLFAPLLTKGKVAVRRRAVQWCAVRRRAERQHAAQRRKRRQPEANFHHPSEPRGQLQVCPVLQRQESSRPHVAQQAESPAQRVELQAERWTYPVRWRTARCGLSKTQR